MIEHPIRWRMKYRADEVIEETYNTLYLQYRVSHGNNGNTMPSKSISRIHACRSRNPDDPHPQLTLVTGTSASMLS